MRPESQVELLLAGDLEPNLHEIGVVEDRREEGPQQSERVDERLGVRVDQRVVV